MSYHWLEHTSELELLIDADSEQAVFEDAAAALAELVRESDDEAAAGSDVNRGAGEEAVARKLSVTGTDRAVLLAAFLEELVYLLETRDLVPEGVADLRLSDDRVTATVRGHTGLAPRHLVKAVTYNELTFAPRGERFTATVVLDV
jgi:SHS2 domain-containing protein